MTRAVAQSRAGRAHDAHHRVTTRTIASRPWKGVRPVVRPSSPPPAYYLRAIMPQRPRSRQQARNAAEVATVKPPLLLQSRRRRPQQHPQHHSQSTAAACASPRACTRGQGARLRAVGSRCRISSLRGPAQRGLQTRALQQQAGPLGRQIPCATDSHGQLHPQRWQPRQMAASVSRLTPPVR